MGQFLNALNEELLKGGCPDVWAEAITYAMIPTAIVGLVSGTMAGIIFKIWGW